MDFISAIYVWLFFFSFLLCTGQKARKFHRELETYICTMFTFIVCCFCFVLCSTNLTSTKYSASVHLIFNFIILKTRLRSTDRPLLAFFYVCMCTLYVHVDMVIMHIIYKLRIFNKTIGRTHSTAEGCFFIPQRVRCSPNLHCKFFQLF